MSAHVEVGEAFKDDANNSYISLCWWLTSCLSQCFYSFWRSIWTIFHHRKSNVASYGGCEWRNGTFSSLNVHSWRDIEQGGCPLLRCVRARGAFTATYRWFKCGENPQGSNIKKKPDGQKKCCKSRAIDLLKLFLSQNVWESRGVREDSSLHHCFEIKPAGLKPENNHRTTRWDLPTSSSLTASKTAIVNFSRFDRSSVSKKEVDKLGK